ncbi:MAG: class I SAM-dependent methyltransferase [Streptosporangiaceae bacterium]
MSPDHPSHDHAGHDHTIHFNQEFWDERYRSADRLWSGQPNAQLVAQAGELAPGQALDAGCGEGADAIWLASHGWTVTAVDVSAVALERGAAHARAHDGEVAERISWRREDLLTWAPEPLACDLVSAQYMHLPSLPFAALAAAVRPGGTLLVVGHHPDDVYVNVGRPEGLSSFPSAEELAATLDSGSWDIVVAAAIERPATDLDGGPVTVKDTVLRATRRP